MAYQAQTGTDLRGLKALVGILGVLIVIGTAVVIGVVIKRIYATTVAAPSISSVAAPGVPVPRIAPVSPAKPDLVVLPAGSKITGLAAAGENLAVSVSGPQGDQLWIINPATGAQYLALSASK